MGRYFFRLAYVGTNYRGSQKHARNNVLDIDTIQGALETAFTIVHPHPRNTPAVVLSGRTDSGVHALNAGGHVDLETNRDYEYEPEQVLKKVNRYFCKCSHEIRILNFIPVTDEFHARFCAKRRTYVYRFFHSKDGADRTIPISEVNRSFHVIQPAARPRFDITRVERAIPLFRGTHDFETFCAVNAQIGPSRYVRDLEEVSLRQAHPLMPSDPLSQNFLFWEVTFRSKAFLYNQIRRIMGCLVAAGFARLDNEQIMTMLQCPSHWNWNAIIGGQATADACGLYMANVDYELGKFRRTIVSRKLAVVRN